MENKGEKTTVERWNVSAFLDFMGKMEKLKSVPRHCVTSDGVTEVVAAHCWRMALMALMLKDEIPEVDMDKVIHMCLLHDIGEAVTGDIPSFEKTQKHEKTEKEALDGLLSEIPSSYREKYKNLFQDMEELSSMEAKVYKALDKLEAVIAHNESDIAGWLPLEYDLQKTYAARAVEGFPFLEKLQDACVKETERKIAEEKKDVL